MPNLKENEHGTRLPPGLVVDTSAMLAVVQGRLSQRASSQALSELIAVIDESDTETRRLVARMEEHIDTLRARVETLESELLAAQQARRTCFLARCWRSSRHALAWLLSRFGISRAD